jgi:tetratricopeptide (TPR) repeat protein
MLYEMVAERPPFLGDDPVAIIGQHVHTPPVAPSWHNPCCPRDLEALILRLLAEDPAQRPESAAEVLTALEIRVEIARVPVFAFNGLNYESNCRRVLELCQEIEDLAAETSARYWLCGRAAMDGRFAEAQVQAEAGLALAERLRDRHVLANILVMYATVRAMQGDWVGARVFSDRGLLIDPADPRPYRVAIWLEHKIGRFETGSALLDKVAEIIRRDPEGPFTNSYSSLTIAEATFFGGKGEHLEIAEASARRMLAEQPTRPGWHLSAHLIQGIIATQRADVVMARSLHPRQGSRSALPCGH